MVEFVCDRPDIKKVLEKLGAALVKRGAYFHPDLRVLCQDNNFSMHGAHSVENGSRIVFIPYECLINVDKFSFFPQEKRISITSTDEHTPAIEQELMEMVVELYNLTGKLGQFKRSSVDCLYHESPDLYYALTRGYVTKTKAYFDETPKDVDFLRSFIDLRTIHLAQTVRMLVPMMEYFNHDNNAPPVITEKNRGMEARAYLRPDSDEFYISYASYDARSLFVHQGFFDRSMTVVKSLPLAFKVEDKKIAVYQKTEKSALEDVPAAMHDIHAYCPSFDLSSRNAVQFSFLYIPDKLAPRSLRRILFHGIHALVKDKDRSTRLTHAAEHVIVSRNFEYYKNLKAQIGGFMPAAGTEEFIKEAREMVERQLFIIKNYAFFEEAMNYNHGSAIKNSATGSI